MINILLLLLFASLFCIGFHAVTRPNMLLWFAAMRVHGRDEIKRLQQRANDLDLEAFNFYESEVNAIYEQFGQEIESDAAQKALQKAKEILENRRDELANGILLQIAHKQKQCEALEAKPLVAFMLKFAPCWSECPTCMASFWGCIIFGLNYFNCLNCDVFGVPFIAPLSIMALAGLNTILSARF